MVTGGELSIFAHGFLPGDDLFARIAHLTTSPFDYAGVDACRAVHNAATFREEIRGLHRHGRRWR